jgi:hypothetical protein
MRGTILQICGGVITSIGLGLWILPVGITFAGLFILALGIADELSR